jgi:hypothetical protein
MEHWWSEVGDGDSGDCEKLLDGIPTLWRAAVAAGNGIYGFTPNY